MAAELETPRAAQAFSDYVLLGAGRSLRALHDLYCCQQNAIKPPTKRLKTLAGWSIRYRWQERITSATTAAAEEALTAAGEIDAATFLRTSELIAAQLAAADSLSLDTIINLREAVRRREPRANLQVAVTLRGIVERVAAVQGLDPANVLAEAERILRSE